MSPVDIMFENMPSGLMEQLQPENLGMEFWKGTGGGVRFMQFSLGIWSSTISVSFLKIKW